MLLGRQNSVAERVARGEGRTSSVDSTDPSTIFKQNYRDMRSAESIEYDTRGVPRSIEDVLRDPTKGGQFSRAERYMIDTRPDILRKTNIIGE